MWKLINISGKNVASLKEFDLTLSQSVTTLIFGHNLDNLDNQPSNGSGKSALIEAIAIAITGEPLRKVNVDEIINDYEQDMKVVATLKNEENSSTVKIVREFSRKSPQVVKIESNGTDIPTASVLDANRYIMEIIGLTKDEVYHNFILTEQKYESFFAAKDRDKKDIINKFSNAQIVDVAIEKLQVDMKVASEDVNLANLTMERNKAAVDVISDQIEKIKSKKQADEANKESIRKRLADQIASEREEIRILNRRIEEENVRLASLSGVRKVLPSYENPSNGTLISDYVASFSSFGIKIDAEEIEKSIESLNNGISSYDHNISIANGDIEELNERILNEQKCLESMKKQYSIDKSNHEAFIGQCEPRLDELSKYLEKLEESEKKLKSEIHATEEELSGLKVKLKGSVRCPKCGHEFFVDSNESPDKLKKIADDIEEEVRIKKLHFSEISNSFKESESEMEELSSKRRKSINSINDESFEIDRISHAIDILIHKAETLAMSIERYKASIDDARHKIEKMFDTVYEKAFGILENSIRDCEANIQYLSQSLRQHEGKIDGYNADMDSIDSSATSNEYIDSLTMDLKNKNDELSESIDKYNEKVSVYSEMSTLEKRMLRFKSKLANTKIAALSQSINSILDQLGSDLRVRIDGFQLMKNGNVRDKIGVSIIRNGISFGSYYKLSRGERCRIDVACIIAMQGLINENAGDCKGLGLLVLDEVLSNVDELGLMDIYEALNKMQQTCLVVSHNQVSASYPHTLTVTKKNGISTINSVV